MIPRSVIIRGLVPSGGHHPMMNFKGTTVDYSLSVLVRHLTNVKLSEPIKYCSIKKLEINQQLSQMKLDSRQPLDKCVAHILKKDIQVPEVTLMLNRFIKNVNVSRSQINLPDDVKIRRWTPYDNQLITDNMETLLKEMKQRKNRDAIFESIFTTSRTNMYKVKTNIIGCFLGQGLPDLRLPCEIFQKASTLFIGTPTQKIVFTESDDEMILKYMATEADSDKTPYASLSKMLGYPAGIIYKRYNRILKPGRKNVGRYTDGENREIMQIIFHENKNALNHYFASTDPLWEKLSTRLDRRSLSLFLHWEGIIRPQILMFENGMENVDIRPILIDYFVEKGINFRNESDWKDISDDVRFRWTTPYYLQRTYSNLLCNFKKANPGLKDNEFTSKTLQNYLDTPKKRPRKDYSKLFKDYVNIKSVL